MKKYLNNNGKYYIAILLIVILLGLSILTYYYVNTKKGFILENETELIYKNNYKMEINYPVLNNRDINKEIKESVNNEKKVFLETIDKEANYDNEFNINYNYSIKDKVYSIHLRTYSYTGKNSEYYRNDELLYFDEATNKELEINDLIVDNTFYEVVQKSCFDYLNNKDNIELYDKNKLEKALNTKDNYEIIIFSENKMFIIFAPHVVSPHDIEITIPIDYEIVKEYLSLDYFNSLKNVEMVVNEEKEETNTSRIRNYEQFKDKKIVALTFDDGPAYDKTETLLTEFEKRNVRASFFLLGELAAKQADLVKRAYDSGHTIGSHTYDHKNLTKLEIEEVIYEIDYTNQILSEIIGADIKFLRPPYGSYNEKLLEIIDMSFILWSVDTEDWLLRDANKLAMYMVNNIEDGDIVLMHDIHAETIHGVIKGIDLLKEQGYEFVSLEELIEYRKINLESHTAYRHFRVNKVEEEIPIEDIVGTKKIDDIIESSDNKKN